MADKLEVLIIAKDQASSVFKKITGTVTGLAKVTAGVALGGAVALAGGLVAGATSGLSFNNSMEIVTAQLNAFTKDGNKTAAILEMIKKRAASTPFAFEEMAKATSSLMSSAKASGQSLESLVEQAEILAASNPAEGLEGAAFALKEAVSGDFTSIIERFNLPRQFINKLKEEGVPNLEIVQRAMQELGLDTSLVTNLAATAQGRWSTFLDTLTNLSAMVTKPIFDAFSSKLGEVNALLEANQPLLTALAEQLAGALQIAISWLIDSGLPLLIQGFQFLYNNINIILPIVGTLGAIILAIAAPISIVVGAITALGIAWFTNFGGIQTKTQAVLNFLKPYWADLTTVFNKFIQLLLPELKKVWLELANVWTTSIKPALAELWKSLQQLFVALGLGTSKTSIWQVALGSLKIILGGVVLAVRGLTPIIQALGAVISFGINNVRRFVDMLRSMKNAADNLIGTLRSIRDKIRDVINAASQMPSWLVPGSPTPFELGIRGIADAVKNLPTMELPGIGMSNVPTLAASTGSGSVSNGQTIVVNLTYSPAVSMANKLEAEQTLAPFIANGVRNYLAGKR